LVEFVAKIAFNFYVFYIFNFLTFPYLKNFLITNLFLEKFVKKRPYLFIF